MSEALAQPKPMEVSSTFAKFKQLQVEDWKDEVSEDEATEEAELARVQQEIERLH
jgi:predicted phosphohydrolase